MAIVTRGEMRRAEDTVSYLQPFVRPGDEVLDVGSGLGLVAELVRSRITPSVTCIDVVDLHQGSAPFVLYDGFRIPFPDRSFDVVVCAYVLHHDADHAWLLSEMKRVTRSRIVVFEDTPRHAFDRLLNLGHALGSRLKFGSRRMTFRSHAEWMTLFAALGLEVGSVVNVSIGRQLIYPTTRTLYVLEVGPPPAAAGAPPTALRGDEVA